MSSAQLDLARTIHREREAEARTSALGAAARTANRERRAEIRVAGHGSRTRWPARRISASM
ncbi:MAG: hypothetical protein M3419_10985 [Actinomycetota bacterium]|nr:hypothetical protein [Actinomycetota bacterium]